MNESSERQFVLFCDRELRELESVEFVNIGSLLSSLFSRLWICEPVSLRTVTVYICVIEFVQLSKLCLVDSAKSVFYVSWFLTVNN